MTLFCRIPAARCAVIATALAAGVLLSCGTRTQLGSGNADYDEGVALFVQGDYSRAAKALEKFVGDTDDTTRKLEGYYYLGRSYLALGDRDRAIDAFQTAVRLGDDGPSREYLERMAGTRLGDPRIVAQQLRVTRYQLAALIVKLVDGDTFDLEKRNPIDMLVERGWMPALPDGARHEKAVVTQAAFYVLIARMLAEGGLPGGAVVFSGAPWRVDPFSQSDVSGRVVVEVMGRVARFGANDGG